MSGTTFKLCGCRDEAGKPLGRKCPRLRRGTGWSHGHGAWYYQIELPPRADLRRRAPLRRGGFPTQAGARAELDQVRELLAIAGPGDQPAAIRIADAITAAIRADAARRMSPGVLTGVPHLVDLKFITVGYALSRIVSACRGGSLTVAAAGGTSQATRATGLRQCGQAGSAARPGSGSAAGGSGGPAWVAGATRVVAPGGRATSRVAALRLRRRRGLPWARCQRCLHCAVQYFCLGAAGVQVNGVPHWGQSRCSALTGLSRLRWRPCG
jgi:hypothetical protein